jgi:flagellar M-ring protein FliF
VQLVLPKDELFAEDAKPATAAVLLSGASAGLDPGAVRGMAQLVASSVPGLALDKVSITDGGGQLLWPREGSADGGFGATSKLAAQDRRDAAMEAELSALLARTVGPDKAQVQVASELNVDKARERTLRYADEGVALREKTEEERLRGGGAGAGGRAGADANIPGYAAGGGAGGGTSNYRRQSDETEFGVDKTVRDTEIAPGAVERQSVSVLLDESVPPAMAAELNRAVSAAAGVDRRRGDTITVSRVPFARPAAPEQPTAVAGMLGHAKWVALGLAGLLFLFFVRRGLRRREAEALGEPMWLREVTAPQSLSALEATQALPALPGANPARSRAEQLATGQPEKVAAQMRQWMQEDQA